MFRSLDSFPLFLFHIHVTRKEMGWFWSKRESSIKPHDGNIRGCLPSSNFMYQSSLLTMNIAIVNLNLELCFSICQMPCKWKNLKTQTHNFQICLKPISVLHWRIAEHKVQNQFTSLLNDYLISSNFNHRESNCHSIYSLGRCWA